MIREDLAPFIEQGAIHQLQREINSIQRGIQIIKYSLSSTKPSRQKDMLEQRGKDQENMLKNKLEELRLAEEAAIREAEARKAAAERAAAERAAAKRAAAIQAAAKEAAAKKTVVVSPLDESLASYSSQFQKPSIFQQYTKLFAATHAQQNTWKGTGISMVGSLKAVPEISGVLRYYDVHSPMLNQANPSQIDQPAETIPVTAYELITIEIDQQTTELNTCYDAEKVKLDEKIKQIEQNIKEGKQACDEAKKEIAEIKANLEKLLEEYNQEKTFLHEKKAEKVLISQDEGLSEFYLSVQNKIRQNFTAYQLIDSKLMEGKKGDSVETVAGAINLAGEYIPLPFALQITRLVSAAIKGVSWLVTEDNKTHVADMANVFHSSEELDKFADAIARKLTIMYSKQITKVDIPSAEILAEVAVDLMMGYLWAGGMHAEDKKEVDLMEQLISVVANIQGAQDEARKSWFLKVKARCATWGANVYKETPLTRRKSKEPDQVNPFTPLGVFYSSGIEVILPAAENNGVKICKKYTGLDLHPEIYDYRKGTQEEVKRAKLYEVTRSGQKDTLITNPFGDNINFNMVTIPGDGNCLFSAVSHQLEFIADRQKYTAAALRALAVKHISQKISPYIESITEDFDDYLNDMAKDCAWGGEQEIIALADALNVRITVYHDKGKNSLDYGQATNPRIYLWYNGTHYNVLMKENDVTVQANERNEDVSKPTNTNNNAADCTDNLQKQVKDQETASTKSSATGNTILHSYPSSPSSSNRSSTESNRSVSNYQLTGLTYQINQESRHCLFRAVAQYLGQDDHTLRQHIALALEADVEHFKPYYAQQLNFKQHIADIREGRGWGTSIDIKVIQEVTNRPIIIIRSNLEPTIPDNSSKYIGSPIFVYCDVDTHNVDIHYDIFKIENEKNARKILATIQASIQEGKSVTYNPEDIKARKPNFSLAWFNK